MHPIQAQRALPIPQSEEEIADGKLHLRNFNPRSTLNLPDNTPQKARFPVIDVHAHLTGLGRSPQQQIRVMDATGVDMVVESPFLRPSVEQSRSQYHEKFPDRFVFFTDIDWSLVDEPGFPENILSRLREDIRRGTQGIGEVVDKGWGLNGFRRLLNRMLRDAAAQGLPPARGPRFFKEEFPEPSSLPYPPRYCDDAIWDPVFDLLAEARLPVLIHISDPEAFFQPLDGFNERYEQLIGNPQYRLARDDVPSKPEQLRRRNNMLKRHPNNIFIGCHMGNSPEDLQYLAKVLDEHPNFYVELGVRHGEMGRQPYTARKFFIKYQDRILFGADGAQSVRGYRTHWRILETEDEYFSYDGTTGGQGRWFVYGLHLPDVVLEKVYHRNARKLIPGLH